MDVLFQRRSFLLDLLEIVNFWISDTHKLYTKKEELLKKE